MPIGPYTKVNAGNVAFDINTGAGTTDIVPAISVNVAGSTNYSIVLEGEPGSADYTAVSFQDTNALNNPATVRFKVDNAAPNLTTPVDVFVWQSGTAIPGVATVPALALNQDSGSVATHPGNSYIPQQGSSTTLPSGTYNIAVVPTGSAPNGSSDLFDGSVAMSVNNSYSLILEDASASQNSIRVLQAIDEPFQTSNQTSISRHRI
jgi:hypothetical protein